MDLKAYFDKIDIEEIERFIIDGQEENLNIEFKTVVHPNYNQQNKDDDKKNISKTLSGFANSNGGIIVWGIKAKENSKKQDIATEKKPINELTKFLNILNRLEGQSVTPIITGIEHKKIEINNDCGFIITYVPTSDFAPHMANYAGKLYYKRSGDSFYACEHYDIKDMFQRERSACLDIKLIKTQIQQVYDDKIKIVVTIALINTGKMSAKAPFMKIEINSPYKFADYGLDGNRNIGVFGSRAMPKSLNSSTYIGGQDIIIHPGLEYEIDRISLETNKDLTPELVVNYMIVAGNMEKINSTQKMTFTNN